MADPITGTPGQNALKEARTSTQVEASNLSSFRTEEGRAESVRSAFDAGADARVPGASASTVGGRAGKPPVSHEGKGSPLGRSRSRGAAHDDKGSAHGRSRSRGAARGRGGRTHGVPLRALTPERSRRARRITAEGLARRASAVVDSNDGDASDEIVGNVKDAAFRGADAVRGGLRARDSMTAFVGARREGATVPQAVRRALLGKTREVARAKAAAKVVTDMGVRMRVATTVRAVVAAIMAAVTSVAAAILPILLALLPILLLLFVVIALSSCFSFDTSSLTEDEAYVASYLAQREFTTPAIAAVMGNMRAESGFDPTLDLDDGYGTVSLGLVQMTGAERDSFKAWCAQNNLSWDTTEAQCEWIFSGEDSTIHGSTTVMGSSFDPGWYQSASRWSSIMITGSLAGYYSRCGDYQEAIADKVDGWYRTGEDFRQADDVDLATFCWMACYERCGNFDKAGRDVSNLSNRLTFARQYLEKLTESSGGGQEYEQANARQKAIADACHQVGSPGGGLCAMWVSQVYQAAGLGYPGGNACDMYRDYTWSTDRADLKVGMIVAVPSWTGTSAGRIYGHVGIYVGDNKVMHNVGSVQVMDLDKWISTYGTTYVPRWGFAAGDHRTL